MSSPGPASQVTPRHVIASELGPEKDKDQKEGLVMDSDGTKSVADGAQTTEGAAVS
jgi:hypothetical protein